MRERQFGWLCFAIACIAVATCATPILAAEAAQPSAKVNLELKDTDVRSAIEALFRGTGQNYAIDANVTGMISALSIKDVSFDAALRSLTKSSGLVFRQDGGVYIISMRPDTGQMPGVSGGGAGMAVAETPVIEETTATEVRIEKIPLSNVSASEILAILQGGKNSGYGGGYGSSYGMMNGGGMGNGMGMNSGYGMMNGGMGMGMGSGYGMGSSYGSGYGNNRGYGMGSGYGSNYGSGYGSNRGYGSAGGAYGGGGYRSW